MGEDTGPPARHRGLLRTAAWVLGAFAALVVVAMLLLNTAPGRRALVNLIEGWQPANGLRVEIGRIDGSIYGDMTIRDLTLSDPQGVFLTAPAVEVDWRPWALLNHHVDIELLTADRMTLSRLPALNSTNASATLPGVAVTIGHLGVGNLLVGPALAGARRSLSMWGSLTISRPHTAFDLHLISNAIDHVAGGDLLLVHLDAAPRANRLDLSVNLRAPSNGAIAALFNLHRPLSFDLAGAGTWKSWRGHARADLGGEAALNTSLSAQSGLFSFAGSAHPGLVVSQKMVARLTGPEVDFAAAGAMRARRLTGRIEAHSASIALSAAGDVNLAAGRYRNLTIHARLLRPHAIGDNVDGRDIAAELTLNGPTAAPDIRYDLSAASLVYGAIGLENFEAKGDLRRGGGAAWRAPVDARAARLTGLGQATGGEVHDLRLTGNVIFARGQITSNNLHLHSDRLDAGVTLDLALPTGQYNATLNGRFTRYAVKGLGVVALSAQARATPAGQGTFRLAGQIRAHTLSIENKTAQNLFGGPASARADFSRTPEGAFTVENVRLAAPKFEIESGIGRVAANGAISLNAAARSAQYGPLHLAMSGSLNAPIARLSAPDANLGAGLRGLVIEARGAGGGVYAVTVRAASAYGPVSAAANVRLNGGALAITIERAEIAGLTLRGTLRRTPAGPLAGALALSGDGIAGSVQLSSLAGVQHGDVRLSARNARLPLTPPVLIARGALTASATFYPGAPTISANAQASNVRRGQAVLTSFDARIGEQRGVGAGDLEAHGRNGAPFSLAASAQLAPRAIRVDAHGVLNRVEFKLAAPAELDREANGWRLMPATIDMPSRGSIQISGQYGAAKSVNARLQAVDLSVTQVLWPRLGLAGQANGVADLILPARGGAPSGRLSLQIRNFTRASAEEVSEPIDIDLYAAAGAAKVQLSALTRWRGAVTGRLQAQLVPAGGGGWLARLKAGSLSGGVRYNGPSAALWAMTGVTDQQLSGPIAIGADFDGSLNRPRFNGIVRAQDLRYHNVKYGTVVDHVSLSGQFAQTRLQIEHLRGEAGSGTVAAAGYVDLSAAQGYPMDVRVTLNDAQIASSDQISAQTSGALTIVKSRTGALISGNITANDARYRLGQRRAAQVIELEGVHWKGDSGVGALQTRTAAPPSIWKLDIAVRSRNQIYVTGMGLDAEWRSNLHIRGDLNHPVVIGEVNLVRGAYAFAGKQLELTHGVVTLNGSSPPNPSLDIAASTTADDTTSEIDIAGDAKNPQITFNSTPALPQDEVLSHLLFGASSAQLSPLQAVQLAAALNSLRGGGGLDPLAKLRQASALDELRFSSGDEATGQGPSIAAGKYLTKNIYVEVTTDAQGFTATQIEIALSRTLKLLSQVGAVNGSNFAVSYTHNY